MDNPASSPYDVAGSAPREDPMASSPPPAIGRRLAWALFFLSGASGLVYEVLWTRMLGLTLGNTVQSLAAVLTAFMGGLALGSWLGGRWSPRLARPLLTYGVLEVFIGLYCAALPWVLGDTGPLVPLYRALYGETGGAAIGIARFVACLLLLLIPSTCMGASLPVLAQYLVRSHHALGRTAGALYAVNTFGAVVGAAATGFLLLPELGKSSTNMLAVAVNLALGAAACWAGAREPVAGAPPQVAPQEGVPMPDDAPAAQAADPGAPAVATARIALSTPTPTAASAHSAAADDALAGATPVPVPVPGAQHDAGPVRGAVSPAAARAVVWTAAVTGFAAMACQIGWTRSICLGTGSSTYAFSLIVSVFILGLGLGGAWGARRAARSADPVLSLAFVLLGIGLIDVLVTWALGVAPVLFYFVIAWAHQLPWAALQAFQALAVAALILGPTFLMGATLPLSFQATARADQAAGRTVGNLYAVNTAGAILGSALGGLVLLPLLTIRVTLLGAALLYSLAGAFLLHRSARRGPGAFARAVALVVPTLALALLAPAWDSLLMSSGLYLLRNPVRLKAARDLRLRDALPRASDVELMYYKEGATGTVAVRRSPDGSIALSVGGKPDASSYSDMTTQVLSGILPAMLHPAGPRHVLVIGFGSGVTVGASLAPESVEQVDVVEMIPEVIEASAHFAGVNRLRYTTGPHPWLDTPRLELLLNDGRNHLLLTSRTYDVISSEPSNPWLAGIGNLFTREAFALAKARLNPGGVMCQWVQTYSLTREQVGLVIRTFAEVFPHVAAWNAGENDVLLVGAREEFRLTRARLRERLAQPRVREALERVHLDTEGEFLAGFLARDAALAQVSGDPQAPLHTDDNLTLEFASPRALWVRESFVRTLLAGDPIGLVDVAGLAEDERAEFEETVDRAARAREHARWGARGLGPRDPHQRIAFALSPHQFWAIEARNESDGERARRLLAGEALTPGKPDVDEALALLDEARGRSPHVHWPQSLRTQAQARHVESLLGFGEAAAALEEVGRMDDPSPVAQAGVAMLRARALVALRRHDEAFSALSQAADTPTHHWAAADLAISILRSVGRDEDALRAADDALRWPNAESDPNAARVWALRAQLLLVANRPAEARASAGTAQDLAPADAWAVALEAAACRALGDIDGRIAALVRRNALDPESPASLIELADALLESAARRPTEAAVRASDERAVSRRVARELISLHPDLPAAWERLARAHLHLGAGRPEEAAWRRTRAEEALRTALTRHGGDREKLPPDLREILGK